MHPTKLLDLLPLARQLAGDPLGLGLAAQSKRSEQLIPRTRTADKVVQSACPYSAVGCRQKVYVKDEKLIEIEGDPDSPISRGRPACAQACPTNSIQFGEPEFYGRPPDPPTLFVT
jgi:hypothetical protein